MVENVFKLFTPLTKGIELYSKDKQVKKEDRMNIRDKLSLASMETRKAFIAIQNNKEVLAEDQYKIADLWRQAFIIISEEHPLEAERLMGKSNSWLTPEFWKNNESEMKRIESNLSMVDQLILKLK